MIIDPKKYLVNKVKVRATALVQLQKKWQSTKVILAPRPSTSKFGDICENISTVLSDTWTKPDWSTYLNWELVKYQELDSEQKKYISALTSQFLIENALSIISC